MIKVIPNHPSYAVSDTGAVYSITSNGLVELKKDISNGYPRVKLDREKVYVSNLVANEFLQSPDADCNRLFFIDGDKSNCDVHNIVWLTPSEVQRYSQFTIEYRLKELGSRA